jgi:hypothetical protein
MRNVTLPPWSLLAITALCCSRHFLFAQTTRLASEHVAKQAKPAADPYLDQVIATVEGRQITRGAVARLYLDYNPQALDPATTSDSTRQTANVHTELPDLAPHIFSKDPKARQPVQGHTWDTPASPRQLRQLAERIFATRPSGLEDCVGLEMQLAALRVAAENKHVGVKPAEIDTATHQTLERIRVSQELPPAPNLSDQALARQIGASYRLHRRNVETRLLKRNLVLADLAEMLGHAPQPDDFYSAHMILLPVDLTNAGSPEEAWTRTVQQAESLRADILAQKQTFEAVAQQVSDDNSAKHGGDVGALMWTLLPAELEEATRKLQPGEITPPVRTKTKVVLVRLDKRGSDLKPQEQQRALAVCLGSRTRERNALARQLKNIRWSTTVGAPPEWFRRPATP